MSRTMLGVVCVWAVCGALSAGEARAQGRARSQPDGQAVERSRQDLSVFEGAGSSIGVGVRDATGEDATTAGLPRADGAVVVNVVPGSPGARAGFAGGDVVVEFDGERVRSARQLGRLVRETPAGRSVRSVVVREGSRRTLEVTPELRGDGPLAALPQVGRELERRLRDLPGRFDFQFDGDSLWSGSAFGARGRLGLTLVPVGDQLGTFFGVQAGVLVSSVDADSPASRAGVKAGDVITAMNGRAIDSPADVAAEVRRTDPGGSLALTVVRDRKELKLTARTAEPPRPAPRRGRSI